MLKIIAQEQLSDEAQDLLASKNIDLIIDPDLADWEKADGLMLSGDTALPEAIYEGSASPKTIALINREKHQLDMARATRAGHRILAPRHGEAASIADYAMSLVLKMARERSDGAIELKGKRLGFVGFGAVAAEIAQRARGFDMTLASYDPDFNRGRALLYQVESMTLVDLFVLSDFVIVLLPYSTDLEGFIGKDVIQLLKQNASLIFLSDPRLLKWDELVRCLDWEYLKHFAIDLPTGYRHLQKDIERYAYVSVNEAANTREARRGNELEMAEQLVLAIEGGEVDTAINVPQLHATNLNEGKRWCELAKLLGQFMGQRLRRLPSNATIEAHGFLLHHEKEAITAAILEGLANGAGNNHINHINSRLWAKEKKLRIRYEGEIDAPTTFLRFSMITEFGRYQVAGDIVNDVLSIIQVDDYRLRAALTSHVLLVPHINRPGLVGQVGMLLGEEDVNINGMVLGHKVHDLSTALMWITIDQQPDPELYEKSKRLSSVLNMEYIYLNPTNYKE